MSYQPQSKKLKKKSGFNAPAKEGQMALTRI
jgi:ribosomal protein L34